jgi:glycosyltransferase involved in cell wall biosynthesis
LFWRLLVLFERLTFLTADVTIATNESYKNIAIGRNHKSPQDVFVVRSGPDVDHLAFTRSNPSLKRGRRFLLGYVGVIGDQEGLDLLLESMRYIVHDLKRHDIHLAIAGSGPSLDQVKRLAATLAVEEYVTFLGRIPNEELFELLSTADVCVNPDRVTPMNDLSTMNKIMEYMAFSKSIVQFDVREGRYSAQDASLYAKANDTVDFAEKIIELLGDEHRRLEMGRFGRERVVKALSWSTQVPNLIAAYRKVFEGASSNRLAVFDRWKRNVFRNHSLARMLWRRG